MIVSGHGFPAVKDDFTAYEDFREGIKIARGATVWLSRPSAKVEYQGAVDLETALAGRCTFEAIQSSKRRLKYGLKIFADDFGPGPCLRFCSRGNDHLNQERGEPRFPVLDLAQC